MSQNLEYILSLRDQLSSRLRTIGVNSDNALNRFAALQRQAQQVNNNLRDLGNGVSTLQGRLQLLRNERDLLPESSLTQLRTYNREIQNLENRITRLQTVGQRGGGMFANAFQSIPFASMLTNPLVAGGLVAAKAIRVGIQDEFIGTSFEVLLKSKDEGKALFQDITRYADQTSYQKMGLGEAAKMMLGFGITQEKIMPNLKMLGDIAMGDAEKMSSLTLAFSQASAAGRLQGQDLLQMVNAGFNPLMIISQKTGKSMLQLRKEMEAGKISMAMVEDAFKTATSSGGLFHGMADKMSQTLGGRLSTLWDTITARLVDFYNIMAPFVIPVVNALIWGLNGIATAFSWVKREFLDGNPVIVGLVIAMGSVIATNQIMKLGFLAQQAAAWLAMGAVNLFSASWWKLNAAMWANPITWIIALIIALIGFVVYIAMSVKSWANVWNGAMLYMKSSLGVFKNGVVVMWLNIRNAFLNGFDYIKVAWYKLKSLWDEEGAAKGLASIKNNAAKRMEELAVAQGKLRKSAAGVIVGQVMFNAALGDRKSFTEVQKDLKKKFGIEDPKKTPGAIGAGGAPVPGSPGSGGGSNLKNTNQSIVTGGQKQTINTFNFKNFVETILIKGDDFAQNTEQMTDNMKDNLLRFLAQANVAAG